MFRTEVEVRPLPDFIFRKMMYHILLLIAIFMTNFWTLGLKFLCLLFILVGGVEETWQKSIVPRPSSDVWYYVTRVRMEKMRRKKDITLGFIVYKDDVLVVVKVDIEGSRSTEI